MNKILYDKKYFTKRDSLDPKIASVVENLRQKKRGQKIKVLDVGCGTGLLVAFLNKRGFSAVGCDPYVTMKKSKTFIKAKATKLPFKSRSFDLVTNISVIEHLEKNEVGTFLKEAHRVLEENGQIFLVTPNFNSLWRFLLKDKWFGYSDPTHIQFFTPESLSKLLRKHGFKNIKFYFKTKNLGILEYLLVSTPFWRIRDSFYIAAQK